MGFQTRVPPPDSHGPGEEDEPQTHENNVDVTTIGVDVMKVALPRYEKSLGSFIKSISDTVRIYASFWHATRAKCLSGPSDALGALNSRNVPISIHFVETRRTIDTIC